MDEKQNQPQEIIKILGIAPYAALKTTMEQAAAGMKHVKLDVFVGNMDTGIELAGGHMEDDYDVIVSRGGTACLIAQALSVPVVEIPLSVYDILRAVKLAENYHKPYGVMGFPNITVHVRLLCELLRKQVDIFTIYSSEEVPPLLNRLQSMGYGMVVCDMVGYDQARQMGMNAILITSGAESVEEALSQAVKIASGQNRARRQTVFFKDVVREAGQSVVIFDDQDQIFFSTWNQGSEAQIQDVLRQRLSQVRSQECCRFFHMQENILYSVSGRVIPLEGRPFTVFYLTQSQLPIYPGKYGIRFFTAKEAREAFFNSIYSLDGARSQLAGQINQVSQSPFPVVIAGERGTEKGLIARAVYLNSPLCANPLTVADCRRLGDKGWEYLTSHYISPTNASGGTLYFQAMESLSEEQCRQLLSLILDTSLHTRSRLIFSWTVQAGNPLPPAGQEFVRRLSCLTICLKPLRERIQDIPTLASLCLSTLNMELGKQISGFDPQAQELLMAYHWPENHTQFRRLIRELAVYTDGPYITGATVRTQLDKERQLVVPEERSVENPNLNRPLEEIVRQLVKKAVDSNHGNQSLTARQLGISRTTLWRYLKE